MAQGTDSQQTTVSPGPKDFKPQHMPLSRLGAPAEGEVHAWFLDLGLLGAPLRQALAGESPDSGAALTAGQRRFARRFYLRLLLGAYLGLSGKDVSLVRSVKGKPVLDAAVHQTGLQFSMAKSGDKVLVGVCSFNPIGVDLEPADRRAHNAMRVARRYFHPDEADDLTAMPAAGRDAAFVRAWACKEAVVKASGQGIANQLCRFRIEMSPDRPAAIHAMEGDDAEGWALTLLRPEAGFVGAVAVQHPRLELHCHRLLPAA
ncbi:4'-phosphopantetheinyl transferase family protein [Elongatibacter sediminis]|uniref:4'-phosphopantetheinyl transferase superfamily protein n=1 Tax=Elongatibacter sediminis TaxID=3119006 RepID=A0AAW9R7P5_9GAMM